MSASSSAKPACTGNFARRCWPANSKPMRSGPLTEPHANPGRGQFEASVARQRPFRPLVVTTAQAEARVLGTRFTLAATTNATRLEVADGKVRLKRLSDGEAVRVGAGNYTVAAPGYELAPQPLT